MRIVPILVTLLSLLAVRTEGKVVLPAILGDNMVLQQQTTVNLWGMASPNTTVTISTSWTTDTVTARSDADGKWEARVDTPKGGSLPQTITISDGEELLLGNILIGEVWLCSGQSNMEMPLFGFWNCPVENSAETIATSAECTNLRMATVAKNGAAVPQDDAETTWQECNPQNTQWMSATAFNFAQMVARVLDVPVGIISCAWGGSRIEGWLPENIVRGYSDIDLDGALAAGTHGGAWPDLSPVAMYNGMIHPLANYTIKGFLWYQGESNVGKHDSYSGRLADMVAQWRKDWGQGCLPFYIIELTPYDYGEGIAGALLREAQHKAAQAIENSGIVCTNDLVYPYERHQIHPCRKKEVGDRAAYLALAKTYGIGGIAAAYPVYKEMEIRGREVEISFSNADEGFGLQDGIEGFEIASNDREFYPAKAVLNVDRKTIIVMSDSVDNPVAVRYCFRNFQVGNLKNIHGMPAIPFRTDDW